MPKGVDAGTVGLTGPSSASYDVKRRIGHRRGGRRPSSLPGAYRVDLGDGDDVVATNDLYVRPEGREGRPDHRRVQYAEGDPITVHWADGPANRWDWIGVYRAAADDPEKDSYLVWGYTGGHDAGALPPSTGGRARPRPRPPGQALAAAAGSLRRPLPAHRPVHQRRVDRLHRALTSRILPWRHRSHGTLVATAQRRTGTRAPVRPTQRSNRSPGAPIPQPFGEAPA